MLIRKAARRDLPGIIYLMNKYGKMTVSDSLLNNRDIALVAYDDSGELAGFVWAGLMAKNTLMYIDKFAIDPAYTGKGVASALYQHLLVESAKRGVRRAFGVIRQDEFHDKAAVNALKMAGMADPLPYTYVYGDLMNTIQELKSMESSHGRQ